MHMHTPAHAHAHTCTCTRIQGRFLELSCADFGALFRRMDAFIVHGGLGTTVEALRMRKPVAVTGPLLMDQRFWGGVCHQKGVGPPPTHIDDFRRWGMEPHPHPFTPHLPPLTYHLPPTTYQPSPTTPHPSAPTLSPHPHPQPSAPILSPHPHRCAYGRRLPAAADLLTHSLTLTHLLAYLLTYSLTYR